MKKKENAEPDASFVFSKTHSAFVEFVKKNKMDPFSTNHLSSPVQLYGTMGEVDGKAMNIYVLPCAKLSSEYGWIIEQAKNKKYNIINV